MDVNTTDNGILLANLTDDGWSAELKALIDCIEQHVNIEGLVVPPRRAAVLIKHLKRIQAAIEQMEDNNNQDILRELELEEALQQGIANGVVVNINRVQWHK